jgi:hypothetical protein
MSEKLHKLLFVAALHQLIVERLKLMLAHVGKRTRR